jgi:6-phosphogluconolactonase
MLVNNVSELIAYVGTYTNGESRGIYRFSLDPENGNIEDVKLAAEVDNPTYLTVDEVNRHVYSVIKVGENGGAAAFDLVESTGDLKLINYRASKGKPPCYVSLGDKDEYLFVGNYHKGTVEVLPIGSDGGVDAVSSIVTHQGSGPDKERQEKAHVHYASLTPDKRHLCVVDLGMDKLAVYNLDDGFLSEAKELSLLLKPGCGPRHMDFHPSGRFAYVVTELSGEIIALEYSKLNYSFKEIQYISTVPKDYKRENSGGAIHISPDGKFLYSSNRGHDSIAVFSIDEFSGRLEAISHTSTRGMHPRDFAIDPTGSFIAAANQNSNNIVVLKIDKTSGRLTPSGNQASIPNPVCIKFLNMR